MTLRFALLLTPLLFAAPPASAQQADMSRAVRARLDALPDELGGLMRHAGHNIDPRAPLVAYQGRNPQDPVIAIVVADATTSMSWPDRAENGRAAARQAGLIDTLFEGKFRLDAHPGTANYFGDYLTEGGIKQSWIAEIDGARVSVLATIYRAEDRRRIFDAIRGELLGGVTMENVSTAEAN